MASRTYFFLTAVSSSRASITNYRRSYASAAAIATKRNRPPATTRRTSSREHLSSTSNSKASTKVASRTNPSAGGPAAKATTNEASPSTTTPPKEQPKSNVSTEKQQLEYLDDLLIRSRYMPTTDLWGQKMDTLDVMVPINIITSRDRLKGLSGVWAQFWKNRQNDMKNMVAMSTLANYNAFPGVSTANDGFFKKLYKWPLRVFGAKSVKPTSWLAPTRQIILDTYKNLHTAIAKKDVKGIKRLATDSFLVDTLADQKKHNPNCTHIWRFHREVNPTQIVSLRVIEGYLAPQEPKFGSRFLVHALVKFDTEQSLEIYDRGGKALHAPAQGVEAQPYGRIPAEKQHIVQYFVLEKRMWYDGPWVIREQVWEAALNMHIT